jgi:hypothetical protein
MVAVMGEEWVGRGVMFVICTCLSALLCDVCAGVAVVIQTTMADYLEAKVCLSMNIIPQLICF